MSCENCKPVHVGFWDNRVLNELVITQVCIHGTLFKSVIGLHELRDMSSIEYIRLREYIEGGFKK